MITVTYITAPSVQSLDLFAQIKEPIEKAIFEQCGDEVGWIPLNNLGCPEKLPQSLAERYLTGSFALLTSDLVIFDGSIDNDLSLKADPASKTVCSQYEYASPAMLGVDHVLIVSRTKLPYNFEGIRKGGSPNWIRTRVVDTAPFLKAKDSLTNDEIADWILEALPHLELPRADKLKEPVSEEESLTLAKSVNGILKKLYDKAEKKVAEEYKDDIFVSYRSKESVHACTSATNASSDGISGSSEEQEQKQDGSLEKILLTQAAIELKDELGEQGHFIYAPPGDLSTEVMTEKRRWALVSLIHRQMERCKAVLIYKKTDYDESWWTSAELMCLSYMMLSNRKVYPKLYVVEPDNSSVHAEKNDISGYNGSSNNQGSHCSDSDFGSNDSNQNDQTDQLLSNQSSDKVAIKITKLTTPEEIRAFLPPITEKQHRRLARKFAYANPFEEASELEGKYVSQQSELRKVIRSAFTAMLACAGFFDKFVDDLEIEEKDGFGSLTADREKRSFIKEFRRNQESLHSIVQTPEFDRGLLVDCPECKLKHSYSKDVDDFVELKHTHRLDISCYDQLQTDKECVEVELHPCGHKVKLKRGEKYYHFIQPMVWKVLNKEGWVVKPIYAVEFDDTDNSDGDNDADSEVPI